jgi:hypothetical protein
MKHLASSMSRFPEKTPQSSRRRAVRQELSSAQALSEPCEIVTKQLPK